MPLRSLQALCLLNFFMADVRDGLGPFLGIFLAQQHWLPGEIGLVMTLGGVAGLLATIPAGLITDSSHHKRQMLLVGCVMITSATLLLWFNQTPWVTGISQIINGIAAAFIGPILTGLTLGLTGQNGFKQQMGKNEAFNHAGNMAAAVIAGVSVWYWGMGAVFILMTAMAFLAALALMGIRENDINHNAARGIDSNVTRKPISWPSLLISHSSLMTIGVTLLLFHLGNAALLPMLSIRVASEPSSVNPDRITDTSHPCRVGCHLHVTLFHHAGSNPGWRLCGYSWRRGSWLYREGTTRKRPYQRRTGYRYVYARRWSLSQSGAYRYCGREVFILSARCYCPPCFVHLVAGKSVDRFIRHPLMIKN
ncbi:MFS transporter [Pectobacterium brasiliense]|nr:MFS transporter [Pectobacterium brasiliense]